MSKPPTKAQHLLTGETGEEHAAVFLQSLGFKIIARNWRPPAHLSLRASSLELDIIASYKGSLIFVEVKSRHYNASSSFSPLDAFNKSKQSRILKAAKFYLEDQQAWSVPCRFDLVCLLFKPDKTYSLEHYENVLSFDSPNRGVTHSGNSPWQPW